MSDPRKDVQPRRMVDGFWNGAPPLWKVVLVFGLYLIYAALVFWVSR